MSDPLEILIGVRSLTEAEAERALSEIMNGQWSDPRIAAFLTAARLRGETVDELVGAAKVMRRHVERPPIRRTGLLDTCGTGGDRLGTFNISTAAAIVAAAGGAAVAKAGNRSFSSSTGSADVLAALGVNVQAPPSVVAQCVEEIGLGFFFAPLWHPAMKHVAAIRRDLRFRTIFNYLGPLTNPAGVEYQLLGVGEREWAERLAAALLRLGIRAATVVAGEDGLDEISLDAETYAVRVRGGNIETLTWTPESFGLPRTPVDAIRVDGPEESAALIGRVLAGERCPARDYVLANAAAALWTAEKVAEPREGVVAAQSAIDTGAAQEKLEELVRRTSSTGREDAK